MLRRFALVVVIATWAWLPPPAHAADPPAYEFREEDSSYTFVFTFVVPAGPDAVLDVLYPFQHLRRFSHRASRVELLDQGTDWQTVRFTYATWWWTMSTTFRREIDRSQRRIGFRMLEASRSGLPVPMPSTSDGDYRVEPVGHGVRITYRQSATTRDRWLVGPWRARARSEAILFSEDLETYVRAHLD